jgi:hypothetical protein
MSDPDDWRAWLTKAANDLLNIENRILYGFVGAQFVLVSHGLTKEKKVAAKEIDLAAERLKKYQSNPTKYSSTEEVEDG